MRLNLCLITCGLPGPAYHGGAVTCWAIVKAMLERGYETTVLSLYDNSELNPYLEFKQRQIEDLLKIGAKVELIDYHHKEILTKIEKLFSKTPVNYLKQTFIPDIKRFFPWSWLKEQVKEKLRSIKPDAVFVYHFDALSAVYRIREYPIVAGVGDLWHLPAVFRWKAETLSLKKLVKGLYIAGFSVASKKMMLKMLAPCIKRGAFAAHYAEWLRRQKGFSDVLYFRTPAHDPVGEKWRDLKDQYGKLNQKPRILMIGDITGTAAKWGVRLLVKEVLPILERELGENGFEIHMVGGGRLDEEFRVLKKKPYVKLKGRVVPPDKEFLSADVLFVPTPITLGIRVRIITGFSYGCCVVTHEANQAGIPEIKHEYNALVSNTGKGLANEIIRALNDSKLRKILEENARKTFEKFFSEKVAATRIVKEIENIFK